MPLENPARQAIPFGSGLAKVLNDVGNEFLSAIDKHSGLASQHEAASVIREEFEEFWDQVKVNPKKLSVEGQRKRLEDMRAELVQVAAMAVRAIIDLGLNNLPPAPKEWGC